MQPTIEQAINVYLNDRERIQPVSIREAVTAVREFVGECSHTDNEIEEMIVAAAAGSGIIVELDSHDED